MPEIKIFTRKNFTHNIAQKLKKKKSRILNVGM